MNTPYLRYSGRYCKPKLVSASKQLEPKLRKPSTAKLPHKLFLKNQSIDGFTHRSTDDVHESTNRSAANLSLRQIIE